MKNKFFFTFLYAFLFALSNVSGNEITFETEKIEILDNGNRVKSYQGIANSTDHGLTIEADNFDYNKIDNILVASQDAVALINEKNIIINANKFIYNKNLSQLSAIGNVEVYDISNNVSLISDKMLYHIDLNKIISESPSRIKDELGNLFISQNFIYTLNDYLIKFDDLEFIDIEKNKTQIIKAYVNTKSKKIIGKDILLDFNNKTFNKNNEPRLKGNSIISDGNNSIITKGVFTTCKKNDNCPPWQLSAKEIKHNKSKKMIYYKDAWLKIYDKPVFYFPKFFHPDPTVKRQSGFLMPAFKGSSNLGGAFHIPYYHVISDNKDFTLKPRIYSEEKLLLQSEYRQVNSSSNHLIDFSLLNGSDIASKSHLFVNSNKQLDFAYFEESDLNFKLEQVTNDTYLKTYNVRSPIIDKQDSLETSLKIDAVNDDLTLDLEFKVYEDLSAKNNDRYEYVLPNYNLLKEFKESDQLNGIFSLNSNGSLRNYDTNVHEKVLINDLFFNSNSKFNNRGVKSNYTLLLKNTNTDAENSLKYEQNANHDLLSLFEYNSSYPLKKVTEKYTNILKPKVSLRYSPHNSKNMRNEERRIDTRNIFSLNRISANDTIEGGASLTYGTQFLKTNLQGNDLLDINIGNIIKAEEDKNLPSSSSLGEKMSDIFGSINYSPNSIITTGYDFALNNNLTDKNYEIFNGDIKINNFVTSFEYLNENNTKDKNSYLSNKTSYNFDNSNEISFETRENKKTKLTEFYNLIYQYRNDCLIAAIEYSKDYYTDRDLKPSENIFLKLTIVPFGKTSSPNLFD